MKHVLLVEDTVDSLKMLQVLLEGNGYRVTCATDGIEALSAARGDLPDIIVSDVLMPNMDGFSLCKEWMNDPKLQLIPFVFYTGTYETPADESLALSLGAVRYLIKPLEPSVLLQELDSVLKASSDTKTPKSNLVDEDTFQNLHHLAVLRKLQEKVSQLQTANLKIIESEKKYRAIYDNLLDVYCETAMDGTILEMSPQITHLSQGQYTSEMLIGKSVGIFYRNPRSRNRFIDTLKKNGQVRDFETEFVNRDGSVVELSITAQVRGGDNGDPKTIVSMVHDVSDRKAAENKVRQLSQAVEQSANAVIITNPNSQIEYVNQALLKLYGYNLKEVMGQNPRMFSSGKTPVETYRAMWHQLNQGKSWKGEFINQTKSGVEVIVLVHISPMNHKKGLSSNYLAIIVDITERKKNEAQLQELNEALEDKVSARTLELQQALEVADLANSAKSEFLSTMSHEIRTPLNGILGMVEILQHTSLSSQQAEMVNTIVNSGLNLLNIINDVLDFSKIEAGRLEIVRAPMNVESFLEAIIDIQEISARQNGVELMGYIDPAIPQTLLGDAMRLRQILVNLLGNAIKFSGGLQRKGKVSLRASLEYTGHNRANLLFEVSDNGIGIDREKQSGLFTFFTQADSSTTRRYGGSGLGLAISLKLAHAMGGDIDFSSEPDSGSTFSLTMPFKIQSNGPDLKAEPSLVTGLNCIVVGEKNGFADDLSRYLTHAGASVVRVFDPSEIGALSEKVYSGPCVIIYDNPDSVSLDELRRSSAMMAADVRYLVVRRGQRRQCRREPDGVVTLDGNAMRRNEFLKATALTAERIHWDEKPTVHTVTPNDQFKSLNGVANQRQDDVILIVEDNDINRQVLSHQMVLLGVRAEIVENGLEAINRWKDGSYQLVLTDLHMPDMDGFELAKAIRKYEQARDSKTRTPIIAYTANVVKGIEDRCRAAGMDDYISKPVPLTVLRGLFDKWLPIANKNASGVRDHPTVKSQNLPADMATIEPVQAIDMSIVENMVGENVGFIQKFFTTFQRIAAEMSLHMQEAIANDQTVHLSELAHQLKSSSRSLGASKLGDLCDEIETEAKRDAYDKVSELMDAFKAELSVVDDFISHYLEENSQNKPDDLDVLMLDEGPDIKILVVDDDPLILELVRHQLSILGYSDVNICDSGKEALWWLDDEAESPELILLDLKMPEMDGIEFVRHLVANQYSGSLLIMSGEDKRVLQSAEALAQAHGMEVLGNLRKPFSSEQLLKKLGMWRMPNKRRQKAARNAYSVDRLRAAINNGELVNFYQPKVILSTGEINGVETLVRWRHPEDGLVGPDQFISLAEENGLIDELTRVVVIQAIGQLKEWQDAGFDLKMAINVSMDNLESLDFPDFVDQVATSAGILNKNIVFEVTESKIMHDRRGPLETLTRLRLKGFRLSIDDFGTGHSSLTQLHDLPFDELKIDKSFVHNASADKDASAIFQASLNLAQQLNMESVAEGIEDRADWDFVKKSDCGLVQGYFIARPMSADGFSEWVNTWRKRVAKELR